MTPTVPLPPAFPPRYEVGAALGRGGFGAVWAGVDRHTGERVALKLLAAGMHADVERYNREVAALRLLNLPGVVRLRDNGRWLGRMWIAMDLVEGTPFPGREAPMSWGDLAPIATALLETLARFHEAGLVHRDLKPSNVLVDGADRPRARKLGRSRPGGVGGGPAAPRSREPRPDRGRFCRLPRRGRGERSRSGAGGAARMGAARGRVPR